MIRLVTLMLAMIGVSAVARAADLNVVVAPTGYLPYYMGEGKGDGIAIDILKELATRSGISIEVKWVPQKRSRELLAAGVEVNAEFPVAQEWRGAYADKAVFSDMIMTGEEVVLFPADKVFPVKDIKTDLVGRKGSFVLGYVYPDYGYVREDASDDDAQIRKVATGRTEFSVADRYVANYIAKTDGLALAYGPVWSSYEYRMLVHKNSAALLPRINAAIATMKADGSIQRAIDKYTK